MSDERYAPPSASLGDPTRERGTGRIDLGEAFREAWAALWANFPLLLGVWLLSLIVGALSLVTIVGVFLVLPVLGYGLLRVLLNAMSDSAEVGDLFSGFSDYGRVLGSMLVLSILLLLLYMVGQAPQLVGQLSGSSLLSALGTIFNLAWTWAIMPRFAFGSFYVVDQGMQPVEALQTAWAATSTQKLTCFLIGILSLVIPVVGLLCLVVGLIPAMMLLYLLQTAAYRQLAGR